MSLLGALIDIDHPKKHAIVSPKKEVSVSPNKERSIYYYPDYDMFKNGDNFESVILGYFPDKFYDVVNSTSGGNDLVGRNDVDTLGPKFRFRHKLTGDCFWVECKFVDNSLNGEINWLANGQLTEYEQFQQDHRQNQFMW